MAIKSAGIIMDNKKLSVDAKEQVTFTCRTSVKVRYFMNMNTLFKNSIKGQRIFLDASLNVICKILSIIYIFFANDFFFENGFFFEDMNVKSIYVMAAYHLFFKYDQNDSP